MVNITNINILLSIAVVAVAGSSSSMTTTVEATTTTTVNPSKRTSTGTNSINNERNNSSNNEDGSTIYSLPMMGHKYVKERKLRELDEARKRRQLQQQPNNNGGAPPPPGNGERMPPPNAIGSTTKVQETNNELGMSALYQGYGTHYVDLWVGTPKPQRQTVIVDTGSSITAFPCAGCNDCGYDPEGDQFHTDNYFNWHESVTFKKLNCKQCQAGSCNNGECKMHMSYAEGSSWTAFESSDYLYAGGSHDHSPDVHVDPQSGEILMNPNDVDGLLVTKFEVPYAFGCQQALTGLFRTQLADGIMGMSNEHHTFWHQLYEGGKLTKKLFSLCFSRSDSIDYEGTGAGAMTIGGTNTLLHKTPMVYVKEQKGMGFFTVHIRNIYLRKGGGESSAFLPTQNGNDMIPLNVDESTLNNHGVIFDSGTTDTYFTRDLAESFKKQFKDLTGLDYANKPFPNLTLEDIKQLPTVIIQLEGVKDTTKFYPSNIEPQHTIGLVGEMDQQHPYDVYLAIPASHYFEYDEEKSMYTPRIYLDERSGSVLGANAMQGHDILFDIERGVIGIAESDCDYMTLGIPGGIPPQGEEESERKKRTEMALETTTGGEEENEIPIVQVNEEEQPNFDMTMQQEHSTFQQPGAGGICGDDNDSMLCKGALGIGSFFFLVGMVVGLPALRRWRQTRATNVPNYDSVDHAVEDDVNQFHDSHPSHAANDLRLSSNNDASIHEDLYLNDDDDMSDHPDLNTNYDENDVGVEIMTSSNSRSIV